MSKQIIGLILISIMWYGVGVHRGIKQCTTSTVTEGQSGTTGTEPHTLDDLLDAIEWVESKGDPFAIGDNGEAVGAYQIHKIYVDDVNRINRAKSKHKYQYPYEARYSHHLSREMTSIYLNHYGGSFEERARKHNGGPTGHLREETKSYWLKVKARMEQK